MKPRFDSDRPYGDRNQRLRGGYRPSARDLVNGSQLNRGELSLYVVLTASVALALVQHAQVAHRFVQQMPEFAVAVANLVRNVV